MQVFPVSPGHAALYLLSIGVKTIHKDRADRAAIFVDGVLFYPDVLVENHAGQRLLGSLTESLTVALRRIDLCQPDFDLLIARY